MLQTLRIIGDQTEFGRQLSACLHEAPLPVPFTLLHAHPLAESEVRAACEAFVASVPAGVEALVLTILHSAPPGLAHMAHHAANAALWAFTRQAALEWAPRGIRVNAIGLGTDLAGPFEPSEQAGRAIGAAPAAGATLDDIAQTIRAIASWPSMTGQIIRLGV